MKTYFLAADRQIEHLVDRDHFGLSLMNNVLFDDGLVVPDTYLFTSASMSKYIGKGSFLADCLRNGLISIAVRDPSIRSFGEMLKQFKGFPGLRPESADLARDLDTRIGWGDHLQFKEWPDGVGKRYWEVLIENVLCDRPPAIGSKEEIADWELAWDKTQDFRKSVLERAKERTRKAAGEDAGIRRGDILRELGSMLGASPNHRLDDFSDLRHLPCFRDKEYAIPQLATVPKSKRNMVSLLSDWVTECYHDNQACCFDCQPCIVEEPGRLTGVVYKRIVTSEECLAETAPFSPLVEVPKVSKPWFWEAKDLLRVREDRGRAYLEAWRAWEDGKGNLGGAEEAFKEYCNCMCDVTRKVAGAAFDSTHLKVSGYLTRAKYLILVGSAAAHQSDVGVLVSAGIDFVDYGVGSSLRRQVLRSATEKRRYTVTRDTKYPGRCSVHLS